MTRRLAAAALLALLLPLVDAASAAATEDTCTQQSRRVRMPSGFAEARVSFAGVLTSGRTRVGEYFPGGDVREIRIAVSWTDLERVHHQRLELYSPDGSLYQRFSATFTGDRRAVSTVTALPVAGSSISDAGLYGEWCAEVFLDDEEAPIARRHFELTPP